MPRWHAIATVSLIGCIVMLTNLGGPRLWDRDEPRNAGCAAEMLARGDFIVPVFNGELRTHKPVLLYWLMLASYSMLGVSEFSARLPSALLAIGTALCTTEIGRRLFSPRAGLWAGIAVCSSLMFVVAGRAATPDSTLIFFSTLAITFFAIGIPLRDSSLDVSDEKNSRPIPLNWPFASAMYAAMGCAALAKGPVGIMLPSAVVGLFQLLANAPPRRDEQGSSWKDAALSFCGSFAPRHFARVTWSLRPLLGAAIVLAIAAPWYVAVGVQTDGEFLRGFFLEHNLNRAVSTMEGHRGNVLFYPATLLIGFFPWSVLAVPLLIDLRRQWSQRTPATEPNLAWRRGYLLASCWLTVYLLVFSIAKTKLPSYITPCYPAAALCIGAFVDRWLSRELSVDRRWLQIAAIVLAVSGAAIAVAIAMLTREKLPGEEWLAAIGLIPFIAGIAWWWAERNVKSQSLAATSDRSQGRDFVVHRPQFAATCLASAAVVFATLLFAWGASRADTFQLNHRLLTAIDLRSSNPRVAAFGCLEPSWVFYGKHPIDEISEGDVHPTHSPFIDRHGAWQPKPAVTFDAIARDPDLFVITTPRFLDAARAKLPADFEVLETVPLFLKNEQLLLLGRRGPVAIARRPIRQP